jgi:hypothetical protein
MSLLAPVTWPLGFPGHIPPPQIWRSYQRSSWPVASLSLGRLLYQRQVVCSPLLSSANLVWTWKSGWQKIINPDQLQWTGHLVDRWGGGDRDRWKIKWARGREEREINRKSGREEEWKIKETRVANWGEESIPGTEVWNWVAKLHRLAGRYAKPYAYLVPSLHSRT